MFYPIKISESFDYNKLVGNLPANDNNAESENIKIIIPLKNLSNFILNIDFLMINTEIELILKLSQHCVLIEKATREFKELIPAQGNIQEQPQVNAINRSATLKFNIIDCKLYVPVVTLQENYENLLLEGLSRN